MVSALRKQCVEPSFAHLLWAVVDDAFRNQKKLAEGREESARRLVARLRDLSPFESLAVVDAAERFWHLVDHRDEVDGQALEQVGLIDEWSVAREADMARTTATAGRPAGPGDPGA